MSLPSSKIMKRFGCLIRWPIQSQVKLVVTQVKLVLAIGATTYDGDFKLRTSAVRWVQEAQF